VHIYEYIACLLWCVYTSVYVHIYMSIWYFLYRTYMIRGIHVHTYEFTTYLVWCMYTSIYMRIYKYTVCMHMSIHVLIYQKWAYLVWSTSMYTRYICAYKWAFGVLYDVYILYICTIYYGRRRGRERRQCCVSYQSSRIFRWPCSALRLPLAQSRSDCHKRFLNQFLKPCLRSANSRVLFLPSFLCASNKTDEDACFFLPLSKK